jgi:hypothetical protein
LSGNVEVVALELGSYENDNDVSLASAVWPTSLLRALLSLLVDVRLVPSEL